MCHNLIARGSWQVHKLRNTADCLCKFPYGLLAIVPAGVFGNTRVQQWCNRCVCQPTHDLMLEGMGSIFQADRHICCFPFRVREIIVFFPGVVTEIITFSAHCFSKLLCSKQAATQTCSFFFLLHISFVFSASLLLCHYWELFLQRMIQACSDHSNILIIHKLYHSWSRVYN